LPAQPITTPEKQRHYFAWTRSPLRVTAMFIIMISINVLLLTTVLAHCCVWGYFSCQCMCLVLGQLTALCHCNKLRMSTWFPILLLVFSNMKLGMCEIDFFISVRFLFVFLKNSDWVRNEFGSVRFKKTRFGSDIIVVYYSCNSNSSQRQWMTWLWRHSKQRQVNNVVTF